MRRIQRDICHDELVKALTAGESALFKEIWRLMLFAAALGVFQGKRKSIDKADTGKAIPENYSWIKVILEKILDSNFGEWLDNWLMKKTEKRWRKRHDANMFDIEGKKLFLKRYTAKAHTEKHNSKVLTRFEQKLKEFEAKFGINLNE